MTIYEEVETDFDFDDDGYMVAESRRQVEPKKPGVVLSKGALVFKPAAPAKKTPGPITAKSLWNRVLGRSGSSNANRA